MHARVVVWLLFGISVSGCGTYVPNIQEFPGDAVDGQLLVRKIVDNINCEIIEAIHHVVAQDKKLAPANGGRRTAAWFENWGVQTTLALTINEKGSINPVVNWLPPTPITAVFNLAGAGTLSSEANRIDKLNSYNTVKQFLATTCRPRQGGLWMLASDLKLREWLVDVILAANTGAISIPPDANGPFKNNVISHQIKFVVTSSGSAVPGWKLKRVLINQGGSFLSASRDRTHDLTITLGPNTVTPVEKIQVKNGQKTLVTTMVSGPSRQAADAHLASQIGSAVSSALKSALTP